MATGYRIIKERYNDKLLAIYDSERTCPSCGKVCELEGVNRNNNINQNRYRCPSCGTEWLGNYYDDNADLKDGTGIKRSRPHPEEASIVEYVFNIVISLIFFVIVTSIGVITTDKISLMFDTIPIILLIVFNHIRDRLDEPYPEDKMAHVVRLFTTMSVMAVLQIGFTLFLKLIN